MKMSSLSSRQMQHHTSTLLPCIDEDSASSNVRFEPVATKKTHQRRRSLEFDPRFTQFRTDLKDSLPMPVPDADPFLPKRGSPQPHRSRSTDYRNTTLHQRFLRRGTSLPLLPIRE
eukprot:TRINITY_DN11203_c0_g1_i1.p1 TRINITY_DN11203_c0_g1~~TRINITY_DN11203_c0_g1_i1.p1  ORF type:complete len:116 (+),score=1.69 TRINITY_DN11203_c0_g1_i1:33-380(+)